jgi:hypothetical protein
MAVVYNEKEREMSISSRAAMSTRSMFNHPSPQTDEAYHEAEQGLTQQVPIFHGQGL